MLIPLSGLCASDVKEKDYNCEIETERIKVPGGPYPIVSKEPVFLRIEHMGDKLLRITGNLKVTLSIPCNRCLEPVEVPFDIPLDIEVDLALSDEERRDNLDEQPFIVESNLDVDQLLVNELLMNLPMKVLCREDCKGICSKCGANLNKVTCSCDKGSRDLRMSAIQDIFNESKEV